MFYITGDTHGDFRRFTPFAEHEKLGADDTVIVLGDASLNYHGGKLDAQRKHFVNSFPFRTFCIYGNHEQRPEDIWTYSETEFCGGRVLWEPEYPHVLFAVDGEIYRFGSYDCIAIGGAFSIDKENRLDYGYNWFSNEQPSLEIRTRVEKHLAERGDKIDIVLSHTCPLRYEPTEAFMDGVDPYTVDNRTEEWLGMLEQRLDYRKWYCGHFHTSKKIDKMRFMHRDFEKLSDVN